MSQYVEISDSNYSGKTALVTFNALEGGVYDLGEQTVPFTFYGDSISPGFSVYGEYVLYYIRFYKTCSITILPTTTTTTIPVTTTTTIPVTTTTTIPITTTTTTEPTTTTTTEPPTFVYFTNAKSCEVCTPTQCSEFLSQSIGGYMFNFITSEPITLPILLTIDGCCMFIDSVIETIVPGYSTFNVLPEQILEVIGTIADACPQCYGNVTPTPTPTITSSPTPTPTITPSPTPTQPYAGYDAVLIDGNYYISVGNNEYLSF